MLGRDNSKLPTALIYAEFLFISTHFVSERNNKSRYKLLLGKGKSWNSQWNPHFRSSECFLFCFTLPQQSFIFRAINWDIHGNKAPESSCRGIFCKALIPQPCISLILEYLRMWATKWMFQEMVLVVGSKSFRLKRIREGELSFWSELLSAELLIIWGSCVCHLNVFGHQCPGIFSFQKHPLVLGFPNLTLV